MGWPYKPNLYLSFTTQKGGGPFGDSPNRREIMVKGKFCEERQKKLVLLSLNPGGVTCSSQILLQQAVRAEWGEGRTRSQSWLAEHEFEGLVR